MWLTRLSHYQSPVVPLPDFFSQALGLRHPDELFGKAAQPAARGSHLSEYQGVFSLIIERSQSRARCQVPAAVG